jgi:hypothetical protein
MTAYSENPGVPITPQNTADPLARVQTGMEVVDAAGDRVGTVTAVQTSGTDARPDAPAGVAEALMATGYLRLDGSGVFASDVFVGGDRVAEVTTGDPGVVTLRVSGHDLPRAGQQAG